MPHGKDPEIQYHCSSKKYKSTNRFQWITMPTNKVIMETCNPCIHQSTNPTPILQWATEDVYNIVQWQPSRDPCCEVPTSWAHAGGSPLLIILNRKWSYWEVNLKVPILHFHDIQFVSKRDLSYGNHIQTHDDRFKQSQQLKASPRQQFHGCYYSHDHSK